MSALTTAQLTFYDITDGNITFNIFATQNNDGDITLMAIVTDCGEEVIGGQYHWFKYVYEGENVGFAFDAGVSQSIKVTPNENDIYQCRYSYGSQDQVAYVEYYNVGTRKMVYTSQPDGKYIKGDLWLDGSIMKIAQNNGYGVFNKDDWGQAFNYDQQISDLKQTISDYSDDIDNIKDFKTELQHRVNWNADGGLVFQGGSGVGDSWVPSKFKSQLDSVEMAFYNDKTKVAWIGGETTQNDGHPQFYVQDATIMQSLNVGGEIHGTNELTLKNTTTNNNLVLHAEANGSFSIMIGD